MKFKSGVLISLPTLLVLFVQVVCAVNVGVDTAMLTAAPNSNLTINVQIAVNDGENIPVQNIDLDINGTRCYFTIDGVPLDANASLCQGFSISESRLSPLTFNANRSGTGLGSSGIETTFFGPGNGYGYGNDGNSSDILNYTVIWNTAGYDGIYSFIFDVNAIENVSFTYESVPLIFNISNLVVVPMVNVSVLSVTTTSATLNATADVPVNFTIYYGLTPALLNSVQVGNEGVNDVFFLDALTDGMTYYYRAQGCTEVVCANATLDSFTTQTLIVSIPNSTNSTPFPLIDANIVSTGASSATVNASSNEIVDFDIAYGTVPDNLDSHVFAFDTTNTLTFLEGLAQSTRYYYQVKACDASSNCNQTDIATFTTAPPVVNFRLDTITNESATIHASADQMVDFRIFWGINSTANSNDAGLDTFATDFTLAGLQAGTTYTVDVQGCSNGGVCSFAGPQVFTTLGTTTNTTSGTGGPVSTPDNTTPAITAHITSLGFSSAAVDAHASEPVHFTLYFGDNAANLNGIIDGGTGTDTSLAMTNLQPLTTYYYLIQGCTTLCVNTSIGNFTTLNTGTAHDPNTSVLLPIVINANEFPLLFPNYWTLASDNLSIRVNVNTTILLGRSSVFIREGTIITRVDGQQIDTSLLTFTEGNLNTFTGLPNGYNTAFALQFGLQGFGLQFTQPILVKMYFTGHSGETLVLLHSVLGDAWDTTGFSTSTCAVSNDLCIFSTTHASYYASGTQTAAPADTTRSGGRVAFLGSSGGSSTIPAPEESFAGTTPEAPSAANTPAQNAPVENGGNSITGAVTGSPTSSSWVWPALIVALAGIGLVWYFVRRR